MSVSTCTIRRDCGSSKPPLRRPTVTTTGRESAASDVSPVKRQTSFDVVLVEDLDDSFRNAKTRHHEQRRLRFFNGTIYFSRKIGNAAVIAQRRL